MAVPARKLLVVDDDPWIAKMLEFVANDSRHTAVVCKDGAEAIERFQETAPDLVLLDVVLPRIDGLKVCEHIKKTAVGRLTPVLVFSGIYKDSSEALKLGADAYLQKPFTPQQIGTAIQQMLPPLSVPPETAAGTPALQPQEGETPLSTELAGQALGRLWRGRKTGVLTLRARTGIKYLFMENGDVVQVRSPATASGVTQALLQRGRVSKVQLDQLERTARESQGKKLLSQLLVDAGLVKPDELRRLVLTQMLWEVFESLLWKDGCLSFADGPPVPASAGQYRLEVPTPALLNWGVRKLSPKVQDVAALGGAGPLLRSRDADEVLQKLPLTDRDRAILGLVDGTKTAQDIAGTAELAGSDASPVLYTLLCLQAVASKDGPVRAPAPAVAASAGPRTLEGPFARALMSVWPARETGILRCQSPLDTRLVFVQSGRPVFARSERNAERLDQLLVRAGTITADQAQKAAEAQQKAPTKRIGQLLVEQGALKLDQLHTAVKQQVQNLVLSLFTWTEGSYSFEPASLPNQESITLDWDAPSAVLQGLRALPLSSLRSLAPPRESSVSRVPADEAPKLTLTSIEQKLLGVIVGEKPVDQLLRLGIIPEESVVRGLATFEALGLVRVTRPASPAPAASTPAAAAAPSKAADADEGVEVEVAAPKPIQQADWGDDPLPAPAVPPKAGKATGSAAAVRAGTGWGDEDAAPAPPAKEAAKGKPPAGQAEAPAPSGPPAEPPPAAASPVPQAGPPPIALGPSVPPAPVAVPVAVPIPAPYPTGYAGPYPGYPGYPAGYPLPYSPAGYPYPAGSPYPSGPVAPATLPPGPPPAGLSSSAPPQPPAPAAPPKPVAPSDAPTFPLPPEPSSAARAAAAKEGKKGPWFAGPALAAFELGDAVEAPSGATFFQSPEEESILAPPIGFSPATALEAGSTLLAPPSDSPASAGRAGASSPPPAAAPPTTRSGTLAPPAPSAPPQGPPEDSRFALSASQELVPRQLYDALLQEQKELQRRLWSLMEERARSVPRELFDQVQEEKRALQEKLMRLMEEMLPQRGGGGGSGSGSERPSNVRPFPGSRKGE